MTCRQVVITAEAGQKFGHFSDTFESLLRPALTALPAVVLYARPHNLRLHQRVGTALFINQLNQSLAWNFGRLFTDFPLRKLIT